MQKIAILSSIAYNEFVDYKKIHTEGIKKISLADMKYAEAWIQPSSLSP